MACAGNASAAMTVSFTDADGVQVIGNDESDSAHLERHGTQITVQSQGKLTAVPPCQDNGFGTLVTCETGSETSRASLRLGGGDDSVDDNYGISSFIDGGDGKDQLTYQGSAPITILGGGGADSIQGGSAGDHLYGGTTDPNAPDGDDVILSVGAASLEQPNSDGDDVISGGAGNDQVAAGVGADTIDGGDGNDQLSGCGSGSGCPDGDDTITGGSGDDAISGRGGADQIDAGPGNDTVNGDDDHAGSSPGFGTAPPPAPSGNDQISGGPGDDSLRGSGGDDHISGGEGDDNISGGLGADVMDGGPGLDRTEPGTNLMNIGTAASGQQAIGGEDNVADDISCGTETDSVFPATGDLVSTDCESVGQELTCPANTSGSCPVTIDLSMPGVIRAASLVRSAALSSALVGGNEFRLAAGQATPVFAPLTSRGVALVENRRQVLTTHVVVTGPGGAVLKQQTVNYVLDATRAGTASLPRTADVLRMKASKKGLLAVRVDLPTRGTVTVAVTAAPPRVRAFSFGKKRFTSSGPARPTLTVKPTARALKQLRNGRRLPLAVRVTYAPSGPLGAASTRTFKTSVKVAPKRK